MPSSLPRARPWGSSSAPNPDPASTQRPISTAAIAQPSGPPAWASIPSWALVGTADHVIPPAEQLFMAQRAGARITQVNASHLSMISRPNDVTKVIVAAARSVQ